MQDPIYEFDSQARAGCLPNGMSGNLGNKYQTSRLGVFCHGMDSMKKTILRSTGKNTRNRNASATSSGMGEVISALRAVCYTATESRLLRPKVLLAWVSALILLIAPLNAAAFEFSGPFPNRDYPFPVKESGVEVQVDEATVVEWLDNEQVIFSALKAGEPRLQGKLHHADGQDHFAPGRVVVWNTRTDEIQDLGEGKLHCAYRGYLDMVWKTPNPTTGTSESFFKSGMYGSETTMPGWRPGNPPKHQDKFTCQVFDGPRTATAPEYWTYQLRVQDGILAAALKGKSNSQDDPVFWVRPDGTRQSLAMAWPEMQGAWWEDWAGVYLLRQMLNNATGEPRKPDYLPVLHPNGIIERHLIPYRYSLDTSTRRAALTRRGIVLANDQLLISGLFPSKDRSGAYLIRGDKFVRLVDWLVGNDRVSFDNTHRGLAVSPDGCKLAFKHGEGERRKVKHTIKMIDLCQGE